jgi:curli biogenesis system outer membrane secretion channel CsgG
MKNMKKYISFFIAFIIASCAPSKSIKMDNTTTVKETEKVEAKYTGPKRRIGVVEFENKTAYGQNRLGQAASDILITELVKSGKFIVVERDKINKIMEEQKFQQSGIVDTQTAVKLGQILGLEAIVVGAVTEFGVKKEGSDYLLAQSKQQVAEVSVDIRVIDVQTGQIILADSGKGITKSKKASFLGMGTKGGYDETLEGEALRAAIVKFVDNISNQLNKKPWSATIADSYNDEIYINAGSNSNINIGLKLSCYKQGKEIRDPKSNLVIGYREEYLGDFEVVRYCGDSGDCSIAKAIKMEQTPKAGDICRLKQ